MAALNLATSSAGTRPRSFTSMPCESLSVALAIYRRIGSPRAAQVEVTLRTHGLPYIN